MTNFIRIAQGIDVVPSLLELQRHPHLWDEFSERKVAPMTPHAAMSDIWLRYRAREELVSPESYSEPFTPVFYPAWRLLPSLRPIVFNLAGYVQAVQIGGIMITRLPAQQSILPHDDVGPWHAGFFNTKVYVPLQANDLCINHAPGEQVVMRAGDAWTFDNQVVHSVENLGWSDRITLIACYRTES